MARIWARKMKHNFLLLLFSAISLYADAVLTLSKAYELALVNHPGYRAEKFKTKAVLENVKQAESKLYPKIDISASEGKYEYETNYNDAKTSEEYKTYTLSLVQPLFHPELWRTVTQTQSQYDTSNTELEKQAQQVGLDVIKTYMQILQVQAYIEELQIKKELYDAKFTKSSYMMPMGLSNSVELLDAKVNKEKASIDLIAKKREYKTLKNKLERLTKTNFDSIVKYDAERSFLMSKEKWINQLQENKDLKIVRLSKKMAEDEVSIRRYDYYPKIDLSLQRNQNNTNDPFAHKYDNKALIQFSLSIYQGGYTSSRVQEAMLLLNAAESNEEFVHMQIQDKFEELWAQRESLYESIDVLKQALESSKMLLKATQDECKKGIKNQLDIMEAELKMKNIESELEVSLCDMTINEIDLLNLTGQLVADKIKDI